MKGRAFAVLALMLVVSACGGRGGESVGSAASDEGTPAAAPSASGTDETAGDATVTYEVWFAANEGFLFVAKRPVKPGRALERAALESLLAGPSKTEASAGVFTAVPDGTRLLGLVIGDGIATVDLSSGYEQGSGSWAESLRLAQVVYTLTQFETVKRVNFRLEGKPVELFGGHGIILDRPQSRRDYEDFLPAALVQE